MVRLIASRDSRWALAALGALLLGGCASIPNAATDVAQMDAAFQCAEDAENPQRRACMASLLSALSDEKGSKGELVERATLSGDLGPRPELRTIWSHLSEAERGQAAQGVPVLLWSKARGQTLPEGVFRSAVLLRAPRGSSARFVLHDTCPALVPNCALFPLAGYRAWREVASPFRRGLIAALRPVKGFEAAHAHLLMPTTAPDAIDVVLIHGLASNPSTWEPLIERLMAQTSRRNRLRVWLVSYPSATPVLVNRLRIDKALTAARELHGVSEPWHGVIVGHSLGGVLARLLVVRPDGELIKVAFDAPWASLEGRDSDRHAVEALLDFQPLMREGTVVSIAAPFFGSPVTIAWPARLLGSLQPQATPELQPLRRIARRNEASLRRELRDSYLGGLLTSLTTLTPGQPVIRRASELALPPGIRHVAIAGVGRRTSGEDGDRVVQAASALHPLADEKHTIEAGHDVHRTEGAIAVVMDEIDRILEDQVAR